MVWRWEGGRETEAGSPRGSRVRGWAWLRAGPPPPAGAVGRHPFKTPAGRPPLSPSPAGFQKFRQLVLAPSWVQTLSEGGAGASKSSGLWLHAGTGTHSCSGWGPSVGAGPEAAVQRAGAGAVLAAPAVRGPRLRRPAHLPHALGAAARPTHPLEPGWAPAGS